MLAGALEHLSPESGDQHVRDLADRVQFLESRDREESGKMDTVQEKLKEDAKVLTDIAGPPGATEGEARNPKKRMFEADVEDAKVEDEEKKKDPNEEAEKM
jgi:hypothetical protein